jgi:hypothetical protein
MSRLLATEIPFASNARTPEGWRLLDDAELMDLPDPQYTIDRILQRRGIGVMYGQSGSCKTILAASLQGSIATGRNWFGHQVRHRGRCCYIAAEDISGFKVRLGAWKVASGFPLSVPIGIHTFPDPVDLRDPVSVTAFIEMIRQTDLTFELVVVDTYAAATPGAAENSSEDTTAAMSAAAKIQKALDCGVLLVHHTNAGGTRERGHSSMRGAADYMISVTPVDDAIYVESSKQRNAGPFDPLMLKLSPVPEVGGVVLRFATDIISTGDLTPIQAKCLTTLRDTFAADGATKSEWRSACQDVAERSFHRAAKILVERGKVRQHGSRFCVGAQK